jgi:hypothetical protein
MAEGDPQMVYLAGAPNSTLSHLSSPGSTLLVTGKGAIMAIDINTPGASGAKLTVYDGVDATGAVMGVIDCTKQTGQAGGLGWPFKTGLFVVVAGSPDLTLVYHPS